MNVFEKSHPEPKAYTCGRQSLVSGLVRRYSEWVGCGPWGGAEEEGIGKTYSVTPINVDETGQLFLSWIITCWEPLIVEWPFIVLLIGIGKGKITCWWCYCEILFRWVSTKKNLRAWIKVGIGLVEGHLRLRQNGVLLRWIPLQMMVKKEIIKMAWWHSAPEQKFFVAFSMERIFEDYHLDWC